jgi:integrase
MVYSFARVSAAAALRIEDYFENGKRAWLRLHEKGGKRHEVPCHHNLAVYLDAWIKAAGTAADKKGLLFRAIRKGNRLTENPMARSDVLVMIKRRAEAAGLPYSTCCHTFRATGITTYMQNGGTLEHAQQIAAHESPRTTKLYDRTQDEISLDEVERIRSKQQKRRSRCRQRGVPLLAGFIHQGGRSPWRPNGLSRVSALFGTALQD